MANQITDGRTNVFQFESVTGVVDLSGAAAGTIDNEIFFEGLNSVSEYCSNTRNGILYNAGSAQNWSNNTFYLLFNCGIAGLLGTRANGGVTVRYCGATVTDFFEVYVAGKDDYPPTFNGGWAQFVVDIEEAYTAAVTNGDANTNTGGTPPATSAIQYVGFSFITDGTMPRMVDNTWADQFARLPSGSAGIIVEGSNGGTTPWKWQDIVTAAFETNKWGTARPAPGGAFVFNTPVQFGINDATNHEFEDSNASILWDNQDYVADGFYKLSSLMGTGINFIKAGVKTGTGDAATGSQGWSIQADSTGARWDIDFSNANADDIDLFGCSFQHGGNFDMTQSFIEAISCLYIDCTQATTDASLQQRNNIINPNTADGVAFMVTNNVENIKYCTFNFSDGHGIEDTDTVTGGKDFTGNIFAGPYGGTPGSNLVANSGSTDAMLYNNGGVAKTYNILDGGTLISVRNGALATSTVASSVPISITVVDEDQNPVEGAVVYLITTGAVVVINGKTNASGIITGSFSGSTPSDIDATVSGVKHGSSPIPYRYFTLGGEITGDGYSTTAILSVD